MALTKKFIDADRLTSEQFGELRQAAKDVFFFAGFAKVVHPIMGVIPFLLYPYQNSTLFHFLKNRFNVILKFRQAGVTELISLYCLWLAMYHPNKNIIIISIKDRVAKKVLRKIKFMYKNLPAHLRTRVVNGRGSDIGTSTEMEFANGSIIASIPTTEDAGRSEAVSLLVIDEAAIVRWAERIWAAAFPTLSTGGSAIINSTAYGVGNFFHKIFTDAVAGGNVFNPIRLYWKMHPERYRFEGDYEWYKMQAQILGPRKTAQEIDGDFLTSGNTVFSLSDIRGIEDYIEDVEVKRTELGGLIKVFEEPKRDRQYFIGADIASGRSNDFSTFSIMDREGDEKACMKAKIPINKMTDVLGRFGQKYNRAVLAPESNDIGLGVATNLQDSGYDRLYYSKSMLKKKGKGKPEVQEIPGWYTTKKNRPVIIAELEDDIRNDTCNIKDIFFCQEAPTFIYDNRNRPIAMNKDSNAGDDLFSDQVYTDDSIFAKAITNWIRKERFSTHNVLPLG